MTANQANQNYSLIKIRLRILISAQFVKRLNAQIYQNVGLEELLLSCLWVILAQGHVNSVLLIQEIKGGLIKNKKIAETISLMNLKYIVLTCVNRDDISDGGAKHFADTVEAIKQLSPQAS